MMSRAEGAAHRAPAKIQRQSLEAKSTLKTTVPAADGTGKKSRSRQRGQDGDDDAEAAYEQPLKNGARPSLASTTKGAPGGADGEGAATAAASAGAGAPASTVDDGDAKPVLRKQFLTLVCDFERTVPGHAAQRTRYVGRRSRSWCMGARAQEEVPAGGEWGGVEFI